MATRRETNHSVSFLFLFFFQIHYSLEYLYFSLSPKTQEKTINPFLFCLSVCHISYRAEPPALSLDPSQSATQKEEPPSSNHPPNRLTNQTLYLWFVARAELLYLSILSSSPTQPLFVVPDALLLLLFSSLFSRVKARTQSSRALPISTIASIPVSFHGPRRPIHSSSSLKTGTRTLRLARPRPRKTQLLGSLWLCLFGFSLQLFHLLTTRTTCRQFPQPCTRSFHYECCNCHGSLSRSPRKIL